MSLLFQNCILLLRNSCTEHEINNCASKFSTRRHDEADVSIYRSAFLNEDIIKRETRVQQHLHDSMHDD